MNTYVLGISLASEFVYDRSSPMCSRPRATLSYVCSRTFPTFYVVSHIDDRSSFTRKNTVRYFAARGKMESELVAVLTTIGMICPGMVV